MYKEISIESWEDFVKLADSLDVAKPGLLTYVYRGHSNKEWQLTPTLLRHLDYKAKDIIEVLNIEIQALKQFRSKAHIQLKWNELLNVEDIVSWWTIMQHYGAPTRLLDWTESIYVAAYFAVAEDLHQDAVVWVVHAALFHGKMKEQYVNIKIPDKPEDSRKTFLSNDAEDVLIFAKRHHLSERMIAQQGIFSISRNVLSNHFEIFNDKLGADQSRHEFLQLIIPSELKKQFTKRLRSMNISASSLFPGPDGLGKSIKEFVILHNIK